MARQRHLSRAPIREALIDIQIGPPAGLDVVEMLAPTFVRDVGRESTMWQSTFGFQFDIGTEQGNTAARHAKAGKRFDSPDGLHVLQCKTNAFAFSRLAPYQDWSQIREVARDYWEKYAHAVGNQARVTRIAVRYINSLPLPLPMMDFADYLETGPKIPAPLPQLVAGFLQRVVLVDNVTGNKANVTQALDEADSPSSSERINVLLDIDAYRNIDLAISDTNTVFGILDQLRDFKNRIFFEYLTEKAVELFE